MGGLMLKVRGVAGDAFSRQNCLSLLEVSVDRGQAAHDKLNSNGKGE
jgi:hypothetical protein